jgi:hypothetical protein
VPFGPHVYVKGGVDGVGWGVGVQEGGWEQHVQGFVCLAAACVSNHYFDWGLNAVALCIVLITPHVFVVVVGRGRRRGLTAFPRLLVSACSSAYKLGRRDPLRYPVRQ